MVLNIFVSFVVSSTEFKEGIEQLADLLNISKHPNHIITLEALHKFIVKRLNSEAVKNPSSVLPKVNSVCNILLIFVFLSQNDF